MADYCSPQRYLANDRNLVREATLTPSSVLPVADSVREIPVARSGTGQAILSGSYSGQEPATFDIQITDNTIAVPLISEPVFTGAGSGRLVDIASSGSAQTYTVQLQNVGLPTLNAGLDFEGVRIIARAAGSAGNGIAITVDQTTLVFTEQNFSLLDDLKKGDGGEGSGLTGAAFDWDTKVIGVDDVIPTAAHRVAFGDDKGAIYLQYKKYVDDEWEYHFVPELKRDIPKGTRVSFVTGGRTITVDPLVGPSETFANIETVYDLLNAFFTGSALVSVQGVIAFDRSPTGQASKELAIRTDAHVQPSTGDGSAAAVGFEDTFANDGAATELVVATCFAVTSTDHPLARLGAERWKLKGSVSGDLGDIVTAVPFTDPLGFFGLTIPQRLPDGYGVQRGRFSVTDIIYQPRAENVEPPPICPVALTLGTEAVDQIITLVWTKRPSGNCVCDDMPIPTLDPHCLGLFDTEGGGDGMSYQADTVARLKDFYGWAADSIAQMSEIGSITVSEANTDPVVIAQTGDGATNDLVLVDPVANMAPTRLTPAGAALRIYTSERFQALVALFEQCIAQIDPLTETGLRADGMTVWDAAVVEIQDDVSTLLAGSPTNNISSLRDELYRMRLNSALAAAGVQLLGKADASIIESGDGCWRDMGGNYWAVTGSGKGAYAPAFNNAPYYSSRLADDGKLYFSTKEFGFQINIKCPDGLIFGDQITLSIGDAGWGATYVVGDTLTLPIIGAQAQVLAGGQDGNADLIWYVSGSVDGSLANFVYSPTASPVADTYSDAGLSFQYVPGGIPNQAGDAFEFTIEGGHWRYRRNGGAWITASPPADIDTVAQVLVDGLSVAFETGAYPSFVPGDIYSFDVAQPWAVSNLQTPNRYRWQWDGANQNLVIDFGSAQPLSMLALARHTIPAGATISVDFGTVAGIYTANEVLTWSADVIASEFVEKTARYLRLNLSFANAGGIGWMFAGVALTTTLSADIQIRRVYKIESGGSGLDQGGNYLGRAFSGRITWSEAALTDADVDGIASMLDWVKTHGDEPFVVIPQIERPAEAYAALLAIDDVEFTELSAYNRDPAYDRRYSIDLPFAGAWR